MEACTSSFCRNTSRTSRWRVRIVESDEFVIWCLRQPKRGRYSVVNNQHRASTSALIAFFGRWKISWGVGRGMLGNGYGFALVEACLIEDLLARIEGKTRLSCTPREVRRVLHESRDSEYMMGVLISGRWQGKSGRPACASGPDFPSDAGLVHTLVCFLFMLFATYRTML